MIDGFGPLELHQPDTIDELAAMVGSGAPTDTLYPSGGRTMQHRGMTPSRMGHVVELNRLNRVIDYPARDMTLTVEAGLTISAINQLLKSETQQLPIDVPFPDQATIGGAIATNASGPRRFGHGTFRDYVIGISLMNDQGQVTKAGGRVVKNVAGYDMCKLYTGSYGTLGIITQVTLKVKPIPESRATIVIPAALAQLDRLLERLHATRTRPVAIDLLNRSASTIISPSLPPTEWLMIVGYEDNLMAVDWQINQLCDELKEFESVRMSDTDIMGVYDQLRDCAEMPTHRVVFQANCVPSGLIELLHGFSHTQCEWSIIAHAGNGIIRGICDNCERSDLIKSDIVSLHEIVKKHHGNLMVTRCPAEWKPDLPIWGHPTNSVEMMRIIKSKLDPHHRFNPGRFAGGI